MVNFMIKIYAVSISEKDEPAKFDYILPFLSEERRKKIKSFLHKIDALRSLTGEWIIRTVIQEELGVEEKNILFELKEYGKPDLKNHRNFHFNISHSGRWVVCVTDNMPVGIDVEEIKPVDFRIAKNFFSEEECRDLFLRKYGERLEYFYDLWTLKESFIKNRGKGLSIPLDSFTIRVKKEGIEFKSSRSVRYSGEEPDGYLFSEDLKLKYFFRLYDIGENYKMAVCGMNKNFPLKIIYREI